MGAKHESMPSLTVPCFTKTRGLVFVTLTPEDRRLGRDLNWVRRYVAAMDEEPPGDGKMV